MPTPAEIALAASKQYEAAEKEETEMDKAHTQHLIDKTLARAQGKTVDSTQDYTIADDRAKVQSKKDAALAAANAAAAKAEENRNNINFLTAAAKFDAAINEQHAMTPHEKTFLQRRESAGVRNMRALKERRAAQEEAESRKERSDAAKADRKAFEEQIIEETREYLKKKNKTDIGDLYNDEILLREKWRDITSEMSDAEFKQWYKTDGVQMRNMQKLILKRIRELQKGGKKKSTRNKRKLKKSTYKRRKAKVTKRRSPLKRSRRHRSGRNQR